MTTPASPRRKTLLSAKLLAVRRVVLNKGGKTPGVDGVIWGTAKQRIQAVLSLKRRGYKTRPLRRVYIPKRNGKSRPLSIPVMACRAPQALPLLGLAPSAMTPGRMPYDLRRLRLHGLIERIP